MKLYASVTQAQTSY